MRILHISDLHVEPAPEERLPGLMASLDRDRDPLRRVGADLMIVSGDLTTYGSSRPEHLALAREWLDGLDVPYLAVPGNHDLGPSPDRGARSPVQEAYEDVPYGRTGYGRTFGTDPVEVRDLGQLRVVGFGVREDDPDGVLPRLAETLAADTRPVILVGHYPLVPTRDPKPHEEFGSEAFVPRTGAALLDLIRRQPNVRLYACGHVHVTSVRPLAPHCTQVTAGSLGQGASTYRVYDVDSSGLTYATALGAGPLGFWHTVDPNLSGEFSLGTGTERSGRLIW
ncbi:metallophosphoesterase [Actinopolymorpha sp. NPDC004070]|uniref:metallophosphoesterase family protein n=1 Tax=Actinopolymorpha sp. NPDC004070 TaxID=3154548 RepID=UPI0033A93BB4